MYTCIGKRFDFHGKLQPCKNTSETPSVSPVTGKSCGVFLCAECANSKPNGRPVLHVDVPETEKPNYDPEPDVQAYESADIESDFDLEEIEL